jgi:hypothetical protein
LQFFRLDFVNCFSQWRAAWTGLSGRFGVFSEAKWLDWDGRGKGGAPDRLSSLAQSDVFFTTERICNWMFPQESQLPLLFCFRSRDTVTDWMV